MYEPFNIKKEFSLGHVSFACHFWSEMKVIGWEALPDLVMQTMVLPFTKPGMEQYMVLSYVPGATWTIVPPGPKVRLSAAYWSVSHGLVCEPSFESLPVVET